LEKRKGTQYILLTCKLDNHVSINSNIKIQGGELWCMKLQRYEIGLRGIIKEVEKKRHEMGHHPVIQKYGYSFHIIAGKREGTRNMTYKLYNHVPIN
jgi:hypothetical protein